MCWENYHIIKAKSCHTLYHSHDTHHMHLFGIFRGRIQAPSQPPCHCWRAGSCESRAVPPAAWHSWPTDPDSSPHVWSRRNIGKAQEMSQKRDPVQYHDGSRLNHGWNIAVSLGLAVSWKCSLVPIVSAIWLHLQNAWVGVRLEHIYHWHGCISWLIVCWLPSVNKGFANCSTGDLSSSNGLRRALAMFLEIWLQVLCLLRYRTWPWGYEMIWSDHPGQWIQNDQKFNGHFGGTYHKNVWPIFVGLNFRGQKPPISMAKNMVYGTVSTSISSYQWEKLKII